MTVFTDVSLRERPSPEVYQPHKHGLEDPKLPGHLLPSEPAHSSISLVPE